MGEAAKGRLRAVGCKAAELLRCVTLRGVNGRGNNYDGAVWQVLDSRQRG